MIWKIFGWHLVTDFVGNYHRKRCELKSCSRFQDLVTTIRNVQQLFCLFLQHKQQNQKGKSKFFCKMPKDDFEYMGTFIILYYLCT